MGGTTFETYQPGKDVQAAFREASELAAYEYGHGGYTGTIAEKPGYTVITSTPMLEREAYALAQRMIDEGDQRIDDKWGNAGAIPVVSGTRKLRISGFDYRVSAERLEWGQIDPNLLAATESLIKLRKGETIQSIEVNSYTSPEVRSSIYGIGSGTPQRLNCSATVTVNKPPTTRTTTIKAKVAGGLDYEGRELAVKKAVADMTLKAGEEVVSHRLLSETPGKAKVTATAPKGATETRFVTLAKRVQISGREVTASGVLKHETWETGCKTQAEARAYITKIAENEQNWAPMGALSSVTSLEVQSVTRRADGQPLVSVTRSVATAELEIEVEVRLASAPKPTPGSQDGWLFFGWASC